MNKLKLIALLFVGTLFNVNIYAQTKAKSTINVIFPETLTDLNEAIKTLGKDPNVKVVVFESDVKGYFFNHFGLSQMANFAGLVTADVKPMFVDLLTNITKAPFITIASIKGVHKEAVTN